MCVGAQHRLTGALTAACPLPPSPWHLGRPIVFGRSRDTRQGQIAVLESPARLQGHVPCWSPEPTALSRPHPSAARRVILFGGEALGSDPRQDRGSAHA